MASQWFVSVDGQEKGPLTSQQLKQMVEGGHLTPEDFVRKDTGETWVKAGKVKGLFPTTPSTRPPVPPLPEPDLIPIEPTREASATPAAFDWKPILVIVIVLFMILKGLKGAFEAKPSKPTAVAEKIVQKGDDVRQQGGNTRPPPPPQKAAAKRGPERSAVITHDPYTQVKISDSAIKKVHDIDINTASEGRYEPPRESPVPDIEEVDFGKGPNGEPIELVRYHQGPNGRATETGFFYRNGKGERIFHGPWTEYGPDKRVVAETIYIHGSEKTTYLCYGDYPAIVDVYHGDEDHRRTERTYRSSGVLRPIEMERQYRVVHGVGKKPEAVLHGRCVAYYDNTLAERSGLSEHFGGIMKEEEFENGKSIGFAVYDRNGNIRVSGGTLKASP